MTFIWTIQDIDLIRQEPGRTPWPRAAESVPALLVKEWNRKNQVQYQIVLVQDPKPAVRDRMLGVRNPDDEVPDRDDSLWNQKQPCSVPDYSGPRPEPSGPRPHEWGSQP